MKIIILGAGNVGNALAQTLVNENHDITVIDINSKKCDRIKNNIDAKVIHGDGASQRILQQIDMKQVPLDQIYYSMLVSAAKKLKMPVNKALQEIIANEYNRTK